MKSSASTCTLHHAYLFTGTSHIIYDIRTTHKFTEILNDYNQCETLDEPRSEE